MKRAPFGGGEIEIRQVFDAEDFGEALTPELREQEATPSRPGGEEIMSSSGHASSRGPDRSLPGSRDARPGMTR